MIYFKLLVDNRTEIGQFETHDELLDLVNEVKTQGGQVVEIDKDEYDKLAVDAFKERLNETDEIEFELDEGYKKYSNKLIILEFYKALQIDPTLIQLNEKLDWLNEE